MIITKDISDLSELFINYIKKNVKFTKEYCNINCCFFKQLNYYSIPKCKFFNNKRLNYDNFGFNLRYKRCKKCLKYFE